MNLTAFRSRRRLRPGRRALAWLAGAALLVPAAFAPAARADDGGDSETANKIRAQMEKILELMRTSEKQLLEATRVGGKKPDAPDVKPPEGDGRTPPPPEPGKPPPSAPPEGSGGEGPGAGERARKAIEEVLRSASESGAKVPHELEELVRMIPRQSSQSDSSQEPDPNPVANSQSDARRVPQAPKPSEAPTSPEKGPEKGKDTPESGKPTEKSDKAPADGEKGESPTNDLPPWLVNLPEQVRDLVVSGDPARVPPAYRDLIARYHKWLAEHAKGSSR